MDVRIQQRFGWCRAPHFSWLVREALSAKV
jgi:hypothetical protein